MSVTIRLTRTGKKNAPSFRIVAMPTRSKRDGKYLDVLGHYNPSQNPVSYSLNKELYDKWISQGAKVTDSVQKIVEGKYEYKKYDPKASK